VTVGANVHLYPSPMTHESRILKETGAVAGFASFDPILLVGTCAPGLPEREVLDSRREIIRLSRSWPAGLPALLGKALGMASWSVRVLRRFSEQHIGCINCHSLPALPLAVALKWRTGARLVYDTHELETEANGLGGLRRAASKIIERSLFRFVDETIVVSDGIAEWYHREYGGRRPEVVLNCPPRRERRRSSLLREALALPADTTLFLYQGIFGAGRGIELMLDAFAGLDDPRKVLVFMGMGPLEPRIAECARARVNVRLHPAVAPDRLGEYTASADVGLCLIEDTCLSYRYCMPNKLFEYLAAGVPAIVSNLPEIARVVTNQGVGWVLPSWSAEALRSAFDAIDGPAIELCREATVRAVEIYSWERQVPALRSVYERLGLADPPPGWR
jgi:glycosyltransferase involved in cell wall biosynthesis